VIVLWHSYTAYSLQLTQDILDYFQTIILALIQGLTEFLPISSSAHLILPSTLFGWPDQGLAFDTAVHLGTLLAVMWYFKADIHSLTLAFTHEIRGNTSKEGQFAINLLIASIPIIPVGLILKPMIESELRSTHVIALMTIIFGVLLYIADKVGKKQKVESLLDWKDALVIGFAQCLALVPGTSRSGITISLALILGYTRESAARISFLLSIPAIAGATTLKTIDLMQQEAIVDWLNLAIASAISFVSAYLCIKIFLSLINTLGYTPFVIYRLLLGVFLILVIS